MNDNSGDCLTARNLIISIRENLAWLAREVDMNANISPDLTSRIQADAQQLARLASAQGN